VGLPIQTDKMKSLVYALSGILLVLVLLEKSLVPSGLSKIPLEKLPSNEPFSLKEEWSKGISEFKNIAKNDPEDIPVEEIPKEIEPIPRETSQAWEDVAQKEIEEFIPDEVPLLEDSVTPSLDAKYTNIYFIKFFGNGIKADSRLVKVPRNIPRQTDPVRFILNELKKGPKEEEKNKGVLNAIPPQFAYSEKYKILDGILYLNLDESIEMGAGPQIIKDRLDQIAYSLIGVSGIRGIKITINHKNVHSLGGDGIPLPLVLGKRDRKVISL
jgi:spore germination protein GerM